MRTSAYSDEIRIGSWQLLPAQNLLRSERREVRLEPRHVDLLVFLAQRQGDVVRTEEIIAEVWGGQVVGDHSIYQAIAKLRKALGDEATNSTYIETVSKRGYRLIAAATFPDSSSEPLRDARTPARLPPLHGRWLDRRLWPGTFALLLLVGIGAAWLATRGPIDESPAHQKRLAVLPFASLSESESDRFIAEGFAIELANALGASDGLQVLGPVSTKLAAEAKLDIAEIGTRLRSHAIVSGSVRRSANHLRISATLTDSATGNQLWSQIFERPDGDAFQIQTEIAGKIATALHRELATDPTREPNRIAPRQEQAYEQYLLGQYYRSVRTQRSLTRAADLFEQALKVDPDFVPAKRELATTLLLLSFYGDLPLSHALKRAEPLLAECLRSFPNDAELLGTIGLSHYLRGAHGLAEDYLSRAVAAGPNDAEAWIWLGLAQRQQGRLREALTSFERARSLEPLMVMAVVNNANALSWSGAREAALGLLNGLLPTVADHPLLFVVLSNIALEGGDLATAHRWAKQALALDPDAAISKANLAMVLAYLHQDRAAEALATAAGAEQARGRAARLYLDRLALAAPGLSETGNEPPTPDATHYLDEPDLPEIEWRLENARRGLRSYFSGDDKTASELLAKGLEGRDYPIERTDYDLFLCSSLADSYRRQGRAAESFRWLERCGKHLADARQHGWRTLALGYVEARLSMLHQHSAEALDRLTAVAGQGFSNRQLLEADPVFEGIRKEAGFRAVSAEIAGRADRAWAQISSASD